LGLISISASGSSKSEPSSSEVSKHFCPPVVLKLKLGFPNKD